MDRVDEIETPIVHLIMSTTKIQTSTWLYLSSLYTATMMTRQGCVYELHNVVTLKKLTFARKAI